MECDDDGLERASGARGRSLKRKLGSGGAGVLRLAFSAAVPRAAAARAAPGGSHKHRAAALSVPAPPVHKPSDSPFMNNMDEISYWVYTKRAPCLFNYDNAIKKQAEQAQPSTVKPPSVKSKPEDEHSPRKKRKLKLDGNSASTEKRGNVYFKAPQNQKPPPRSCKSREDGSDADFIVKPPSTQKKSKTIKPRNCQSRVPKKTKVSTSTPKTAILRRSNRKIPQNMIDLDSSFEKFNSGVVNGNQNAEAHQPDIVVADRTPSKVMPPDRGTNEVTRVGLFEDLSDVSGFTANYIRSTRIHSAKRRGQKLRNKNSRAPSKHTKPGDKIIVCQAKAVNTVSPDAVALNCSTDSSQNALNLLVTVRSNEKGARANKSTSLLKFMETKLEHTNANSKVKNQESKCNLNISFQSRSSGVSRYPRRHKNNTANIPEPDSSTNIHNSNVNTTRRYNMRKGTLNSNRKENSEEPVVSRTRSGRRRGMKLEDEESGGPVPLNSCIEPVSSTPAVNVACPNTRSVKRSATTTRCLRSRTVKDKVGQSYKDSASEGGESKLDDGMPRALEQSTPKCVKKIKNTMDKSGNSLRDSLRDKSGFAACFSDSGSDSVPLKQKKFFC